MQIQNNPKIEIHNHNHSSATNEMEKGNEKPKKGLRKYERIIALIVSIIIALIYNWDKIFVPKNSNCGSLTLQLQKKQDELKTIKEKLLNKVSAKYLILSSDSLAHEIQIETILKELKINKCKE